MNQQKLQDKRRKRQAKRKIAQATARRRGAAEKAQRDRAVELLRNKPRAARPGFLDRLLGGAQVTPDQMDAEAAPIVGGA